MLTDPINKNERESTILKSIAWRHVDSPAEEGFPWMVECSHYANSVVAGFVINTHTVINTDKGTRYAY